MHVTELMGTWWGLHAATICLQALQIGIEGDSLTIVGWITRLQVDRDRNQSLLKDIMGLKATQQIFCASHIFLEANQAADYLASKALYCSLSIGSDDCILTGLAGS